MIGSTLGHYQVTEKIGEGGMGEVYRARDTRLDRDVAIKVLPSERVGSSEARARFEREAKAVAALSHPNILAIHEFGEQDGVVYAVTELLGGASLLEAIKVGPVAMRRGLDIASQIAEGLAAAHDRGIIHRDIKPANIFLMPDGRVKILDFGLAKEFLPAGDQTQAATQQADDTAPGTLMGTVRYMSPEQVRAAGDIDHRSDIFSFGTVLWEMFSGQVAFERATSAESMTAILNEELPDIHVANDMVPVSVDRIVRRCLEKAPERRFQSAQDLGFALKNAFDGSSGSIAGVAPPVTEERQRGIAWGPVLAALVIGLAIGAFTMQSMQTAEEHTPVKVRTLTHSARDSQPNVSPDGSTIAFASQRDGHSRIWLRQLKGGVEAPLTEGPDAFPRFSPDGNTILFQRDDGGSRSSFRVPMLGGSARKILEDTWDSCWSPDGTKIGFVRAGGDAGDPITYFGIHELQTGNTEILAELPNIFVAGIQWSPNGRYLIGSTAFAVQNVAEKSLTMVDVDTGEVSEPYKTNTPLSTPTWTSDSSAVLFGQSQSLLGDISSPLGQILRLDIASKEISPLFWVQSVWAGSGEGVMLSLLDDDTLVFDEILWRGSLGLVNLVGDEPHEPSRLYTTGLSRDRQPAYAPDGDRVIFSSNRSGNLDLWVLRLSTGELQQLTDDDAEDWDPAFSVDGERIFWSSNRSGHLEIWTASADGSGARQISDDGVDAENPTQTRDGQWVVYTSANIDKRGVWRVRPDGTDAELIWSDTCQLPEVSPDGQSVAFVRNDPVADVAEILVLDLATQEIVFSTGVDFYGYQGGVADGRVRWMPSGDQLVIVTRDENEQFMLWRQDFVPNQATEATRIPFVQSGTRADIESFGISPDGNSMIISIIDHERSIKIAEGIGTK